MNAHRSVISFTLAAVLSGGVASAAEQGTASTKAHHDHAGEIPSYEGTKTCAECHEQAVKDVAVSLHYQQLGDAPNLDDWPAGKKAGMMSNYWAPPNTVVGHNWIGILQPKDATKPAQPGGCVQCHPGLGAKPNPSDKVTEADYQNIDCLFCHAPDYKRTVVKEGAKFKIAPAPGVDLLKAAQSVRRPSNEMCLRCHLGAGGGPNHKHGVTPTQDSDVHVAKGLQCVDCHTTRKHRMAGGADLKAQEAPEVRVDCTNCHTEAPHKGERANDLNGHVKRLACQTCHIPAIARDPKFPTATSRDWTKPVLNEKTGLYGPTNTMAGNVKPEYRWWNRRMRTPPEPVGSISDSAAKIYPWKHADYTVVSDAATGKAVWIKAGVYAVTGDPGAAAKKGAEDSKQEYSGAWKGTSESMVFSLNHQVAPKTQALACSACHDPKGVLDFKALGYDEAKAKELMTAR